MVPRYRSALIIGAGQGSSASFARRLAADGLDVTLAARDLDRVRNLAGEIGARPHRCDAGDPDSIRALFDELDGLGATPDVVHFNPSARVRGAITELDAEAVQNAVQTTAMGAFVAAQEAAKRMTPIGHGAILFTGATASVKGVAGSAPFAMGKFALRGLAQSLARELQPQGIHVGHVIIDGAIRNPGREEPGGKPDSMLDPDGVAAAFHNLLHQDRSAWSWEVEVRPWLEPF